MPRTSGKFYVLLTAQLGIFLFNDQLDTQFFLCMFISILYTFRACKCSSSADSVVQGDTKKWELLKNPTKIEEIQERKKKNLLTEIEPLQLAF